MKHTTLLLIATLCGIGAYADTPHKVGAKLSPHTSVIVKHQLTDVDAESIVPIYITIDSDTFDAEALSNLGINYSMVTSTIATARVPQSKLSAISEIPGVEYVQAGTPAQQMLDVARPELGVDAIHAATAFENTYTGKGVIVGIVDSGFDYAHAAFRNSDGQLRISRVWEQWPTPDDSQHSPEPWGYGIEFTTADEILKSAADIPNNSHGSHVASIAAGSDSYLDGALKGMAPDAEIVLVSMVNAGTANVNISDAIAYIFAYADQVGKPCVVNLSLGGQKGPHDGTSTFDVIADALQGPGRLIIGASGNNTGNTHHIHHVFDGSNEDTVRTFLDYTLTPSERNMGGETEIWVSPDMNIEVSMVVYKTTGGALNEAERVVIYPTETSAATDISLGRNILGTFTVASEMSPLNGKHHLLLKSMVTSIRTGYAIAIETAPKGGTGSLDMWTDVNYHALSSRGYMGFSDPSGSTLCEIGGTAKRILTVGAYTTRSEFTPLGQETPHQLNETVGDISSFSCYGPTADGRIKPQITAPGCYISAAVSSYDSSGTLTYSAYHDTNGKDNFYGFMQGTSMATPMVTGIVATWLEANPDLTPEMLADIVTRTARTDSFTGTLNEGSVHWGFGKIDAVSGLRECLNASVSSITSDTKQIATLKGSTLTFRLDNPHLRISAYTVQGTTVLDGIHNVKAGDSMHLDLPAGFYILSCGDQVMKVNIR